MRPGQTSSCCGNQECVLHSHRVDVFFGPFCTQQRFSMQQALTSRVVVLLFAATAAAALGNIALRMQKWFAA
jgi:hypothetical protein